MNQTNKEELDYLALQIIPTFMEQFKQYCTSVGDIELASTLTGVNSLPALMNIGGVYKVVEVPLSLITRINEEPIAAALAAAQKANESATRADASTAKATTAAGSAESKAALAETAAGKATASAQLADNSASVANASADRAEVSADNADAKAALAETNALLAKELAEHPIRVGADNYVYTWNLTTHTYDKTEIYVRGEGFSVKKVFASVAEMEAYEGDEFKEGDFALINTGDVDDPDTAKLYSRTAAGSATKWQFLVDMSGAIGFTGKTPQFVIGDVVTGAPDSPAGVSLTPRGADAAGNPVFALNITIPKGDTFTFADLTPEQVRLLQQPANDMIEQLQATNRAVADVEALRVTAEEGRVTAEALRVTAESARDAAELERQENTAKAIADNHAATLLANTAGGNANTQATLAGNAASAANASAIGADFAANRAKELADNPTKMGENGNWWQWDDTLKKYVDTGVLAKGGVIYPTFSIEEEDMVLYMSFEDEVSPQLIKFDEATGELFLNVG